MYNDSLYDNSPYQENLPERMSKNANAHVS
jgi:hypothetical protein